MCYYYKKTGLIYHRFYIQHALIILKIGIIQFFREIALLKLLDNILPMQANYLNLKGISKAYKNPNTITQSIQL